MKKIFYFALVFNFVTWGFYFIFNYFDLHAASAALLIANPALMLTDIYIEDGISSLIIFKIIIGILIETLYISSIGFLLKYKDFYLRFVALIISSPYLLGMLFIAYLNILYLCGIPLK
ncbi:MAG: hypothetical protein R3Y11_05050 [Pseudomonadota bacterium]